MLTLFGDIESGNVHKAQMILRRVSVPFRRVDVAQSRGEPGSQKFLQVNPMGKVPVVLFDNGDVLSESGAILFFFGRNTDLWPKEHRDQSEALRWMFFEQYSHEPSIAVIRFLTHYDTGPANEARIQELMPKARHALEVMEQRLEFSEWIACQSCTLADYALYPYTSVIEDSGFDPESYPNIKSWISRIQNQSNFLAMGNEGSQETITFSEYISKLDI